jgi:signal transduction histidine kinase
VKFLGAVTDVTERRTSEERLQQSSEELRALSERLRVVREEEGARIAREVHDEIGQSLTALQMDLAWLSTRVAALGDPAADPLTAKLRSMAGLLGKTLDVVQRIATELRPGVLDELGLEAAVDWYVREFERRASIPCRLRCDLEGHRVSAALATAVFRILQEALTNVWRHSGATRTDVHLAIDGGQLCLAIEDNGEGVAADRVEDFRSLGLLGVQERARALGGSVAIRGVPGRGTRVAVTFPV